MERVQVQGSLRNNLSKGELKKLRSQGMVPGIVYGRQQESVPVTLDGKALAVVMNSAAGINTLLDLNVEGQKDTVMIKSLERDILFQERLTHVDFIRISLKEKIEVNIPVNLIGEAEGVKDGGILQQPLREVVLKCLPTAIPDHINLDVSGLGVGETLTVADLATPDGTEMVTESTEAVVTVIAPRVAEERPDGTEDAEAAEEKEEEV